MVIRMKKKNLIIFSIISFLCFIEKSYALTATVEVGKTSSQSIPGNCTYSDNNGHDYFDLKPLSDGSGTNVSCKKVTNGEVSISCSSTENSIADSASSVKCVPATNEATKIETNASPCTQEKPCFRGTSCTVTDSSVLSSIGPASINNTVYTQYACQKNGITRVTCNYNGATESTSFSCTGMEEEITYDVILDGNCISRGSSIQFKGHPSTDKTGFVCSKPKENAIATIECTLSNGHIKFYGNYNCSNGTYQDNEGNNLTGGVLNNNENNNETGNEPSSETLKHFCDVNENPDVMRAFKAGGLALNILKIMIPILLIILGGIDFAQAVISSDEKQISKSTMKLVQRVIAGIAIFLVPTLVEYVFDLVDTNATNRYKNCYECLLDVSKCPEIPKVGENR